MSIPIPDELPAFPIPAYDAHKGTSGKLAIIGGSIGLTGSVVLAQRAALRLGAGLVRCLIPESLNAIFETKTLEAMTVPVSDHCGHMTIAARDTILESLDGYDALVLGPGWGRFEETTELLSQLLPRLELPVLIDADGLWHLSQLDLDPERVPEDRWVVTPHSGELDQLLEAWLVDESALRERLRGVVVVKGPRTRVIGPTSTYRNFSGNPGLATGGTGDVLSGVIGALLAKGLSGFEAASLGVWLHGRAADHACYGNDAATTIGRPDESLRAYTWPGEVSLIASDVVEALPAAIREYSQRPQA